MLMFESKVGDGNSVRDLTIKNLCFRCLSKPILLECNNACFYVNSDIQYNMNPIQYEDVTLDVIVDIKTWVVILDFQQNLSA